MSAQQPAPAAESGPKKTGCQPPPVDLSVQVGPLRLDNPVMTASGTFGYGDEHPDLTGVSALGAVVTKTTTVEPRAGNPPPRLFETPAGILNSIGLQNVGAEVFVRDVLPRLRELGPAIIVSVGGSRPQDFAHCVELIQGDGLAAFELNISCPNVASGLEFSRSPAEAAKVVRAVRSRTDMPLFVKLSPNVTDIASVGRACIEEGADGLTAVNTFLGMAVDVERRRPVLPRSVGGLSGPAIRPLALCRVWELARRLSCPIIGVGGIVTARDAMEFLLVGASAIQVGTANLRDPSRGARLVEGLREMLRAKGGGRLRDQIGTLRTPLSEG
ncbi:MAG: dihydroorotate dehydrogenase [Candidatus Eisenbacteria sp.]|nr:dihydroorotate dehydrogenase [Candidatus Eisenbacteria bacterium]